MRKRGHATILGKQKQIADCKRTSWQLRNPHGEEMRARTRRLSARRTPARLLPKRERGRERVETPRRAARGRGAVRGRGARRNSAWALRARQRWGPGAAAERRRGEENEARSAECRLIAGASSHFQTEKRGRESRQSVPGFGGSRSSRAGQPPAGPSSLPTAAPGIPEEMNKGRRRTGENNRKKRQRYRTTDAGKRWSELQGNK